MISTETGFDIQDGQATSPLDPTMPLLAQGDSAKAASLPSTLRLGFCGRIRQCLTADSIGGAVFNLSNSTIGAGVLFLPFVLRECGVAMGLGFIMFGGILGAVTLYLLHKCYEIITTEHDPSIIDYEQIGALCYGPCLSFFVQFCIFILNFGCTISYFIVVSDLLHGWIPDKTVHAFVLLGVMTPFVLVSMSPMISNLRFMSYFSISTILTFVLFVIIAYGLGETKQDRMGEFEVVPDMTKPQTYNHIFSVLGVVTFAYACHTNLCPVASEFKPENRHMIGTGIFVSIFIDYVLYAGIAGFGYLSFLANTQSDIISSYSGDGWIQSLLRAVLALSICATYPMAAYPARYALNNFVNDLIGVCCPTCVQNLFYDGIVMHDEAVEELKQKQKQRQGQKANGGLNLKRTVGNFIGKPTWQKKVFDWILIIVNTILIGLVSYLFAIFYPHAADIFGLVGSTASTCTAYIFPCLFYLKLARPKWYSCRAIWIVVILIFGCCFGVFVTGNSLYKMISTAVINSKKHHH